MAQMAPSRGCTSTSSADWNWYDVDGSRVISKNAFSATSYPVPDTNLAGPFTAYIYDGGQPVMLLQRNVSGSWVIADRMVVAGVDRPLAGLYNGQYLALVADRSGTVQAGVQPTGAADQQATYADHGPFGNIESTAGANLSPTSDLQAGFTGAGGTPNGLGLVYLRNRWYDPGTGRFLTQDPIGLAGGLNLYAYAGNNPVGYSDPFGLNPGCLDPVPTDCPIMKLKVEIGLLPEGAHAGGKGLKVEGKLGAIAAVKFSADVSATHVSVQPGAELGVAGGVDVKTPVGGGTLEGSCTISTDGGGGCSGQASLSRGPVNGGVSTDDGVNGGVSGTGFNVEVGQLHPVNAVTALFRGVLRELRELTAPTSPLGWTQTSIVP